MRGIKIVKLTVGLCFCLCIGSIKAQTGALEGIVTDSLGKPLESVVVSLTNTKFSSITNKDGSFIIQNIAVGKYSCGVTLVGYETAFAKVQVKENDSTRIQITLKTKVTHLQRITVDGVREGSNIICVLHVGNTMNREDIGGIERQEENRDGIIYSGKKNTVLAVDSMNSNDAQSNMSEVLGKVPGANIAEAQYSGFPYCGIGFRGFDATQGINVNIRQNGYNITSDLYGHPESYYIPPMEAVQEIDVISGESSLQFGPQFGGVVNYILKDAPTDKPFQFNTSQTVGSFGLFNSFNSVGGTVGKWSYYAFGQYQGLTGWRPNSQEHMGVGFARVQYKANSNLIIGIEYTLQRNLIHMPGGLDDAEFEANPDQSVRPRNWISTPWNLIALTAEWKPSEKTLFTLKSVANISARNLVWRNDDISISRPDSIDPATNSYAVREVEHESFQNSTTELRMLSNYPLAGKNQTIAIGVRYYNGYMLTQDRGPGSTGSDFDMGIYQSTFGRQVNITCQNIAAYIENIFHIGKRLSITPGFRYEYLTSSVNGYYANSNSIGIFDSAIIPITGTFTRYIPLAGIGIQFTTTSTTNVYANITQTYNPLNYEDLYPAGVDETIDPKLHDVQGFNSDVGFRGTIKKYLAFDVGGFYTAYNGAIATESLLDANGNPYTYETNVGNGVHEGVESYIDWNIVKSFTNNSPVGNIDVYNSFSYDNAKYVSGPFSGNWVECAPQFINRTGITYTLKNFSTTLFINYISQSFADANNTAYSSNAEVGIIPAYQVYNIAAKLKIKNYELTAGINNLANASYFTMRVTEYPGPGIIPGIGRSFYMGVSARF